MAYSDIREVKAIEIQSGVEERILVSPEKTPSKRFTIKHIVVGIDSRLGPVHIDEETIYFIIGGRGTLKVNKVHADWSSLIESNTAVWIPSNMEHSIINSGEDSIRCLALRTRLDHPKTGWTELIDSIPDARDLISSGGCRFFTGPGRIMRDLGAERFTLCGCADIMPGNTLAPHVPLFGAEEIMYVLRGEGRITSGDREFAVKPGSIVYAPPNTMHGMQNTGEDIMRFIFCECLP